ncbi:MAG: benzoate-CoA ligase family protein [Proteobacteria bacterium]|nr:benzoate-CoA ligase family protein [Pseudomonadota bacterium]
MPMPYENLAVRLVESALQHDDRADRVAVRQGAREVTYRELADQVARVSTGLRSVGIERGERVAVLMRDSVEAVFSILGIVHMGAVAVPLSELARPLDIRAYLLHCGATAAITEPELEPVIDEIRTEVDSLRQIICVGEVDSAGVHEFGQLIADAVPASTAAAVKSSQTALILYSVMGAESAVRGVPHAHGTPLAAYSSFARGVIGLDADDRVFASARLSTIYGLGAGLFFPLMAGAETLLLPEQPHSAAIFAALESFDPTIFLATPSVYGQLARDAEDQGREKPLSRCRACISGAEGMPPKLVPRIRDTLGAGVTVGYGLTEAFQFVFAGTAGEGPLGNVGRPVPGFEARIVDGQGAPMGPDAIGILQIRGPTVLSSYWGEKATADQFDGEWFTTRDRFMMDEHGYYYHCGRVDDLFKVGGKWVSPIEVERALLAREEVWDCAVIGADDEDGLIKPFAFVVPNIGHSPSEQLEMKLRESVKTQLAPYKYPRWFEFRDKLPRGPGGKLLRYKLRPTVGPRRAETAADSERD